MALSNSSPMSIRICPSIDQVDRSQGRKVLESRSFCPVEASVVFQSPHRNASSDNASFAARNPYCLLNPCPGIDNLPGKTLQQFRFFCTALTGNLKFDTLDAHFYLSLLISFKSFVNANICPTKKSMKPSKVLLDLCSLGVIQKSGSFLDLIGSRCPIF